MFIDHETLEQTGTPLGVPCMGRRSFLFWTVCEIHRVFFGVVGRGHRTSKGVQNFGTLENYKYCTPPE
jgi:hypothetical protein